MRRLILVRCSPWSLSPPGRVVTFPPIVSDSSAAGMSRDAARARRGSPGESTREDGPTERLRRRTGLAQSSHRGSLGSSANRARAQFRGFESAVAPSSSAEHVTRPRMYGLTGSGSALAEVAQPGGMSQGMTRMPLGRATRGMVARVVGDEGRGDLAAVAPVAEVGESLLVADRLIEGLAGEGGLEGGVGDPPEARRDPWR